jgi:hypothetical protein
MNGVNEVLEEEKAIRDGIKLAHYIADIPPPEHFKPRNFTVWYDHVEDVSYKCIHDGFSMQWKRYREGFEYINDGENFVEGRMSDYWINRLVKLWEILGYSVTVRGR